MGDVMQPWFRALAAVLLGVWLLPAPAHSASQKPLTMVRGHLVQGGFYVGKVDPAARVTLDRVRVPVLPNGEFLVGFDRHQPARTTLEICDAVCARVTLAITPRSWKTQNVRGVPQQNITPNPAQEERAAADAKATKLARQQAMASSHSDWRAAWVWPARGVLSGVFGSRRLYDGAERSWHKGTDIAAPTGTPVVAPAGGVVRLARDTFMSGNLLMLDHGYGVTSVYAHLSRMDVQVGDRVAQGQVIGAVGTTGRSSGPHLHWGIYWRDTPLDAKLWVAGEPQPEKKKVG
jgi:hypothetical protein